MVDFRHDRRVYEISLFVHIGRSKLGFVSYFKYFVNLLFPLQNLALFINEFLRVVLNKVWCRAVQLLSGINVEYWIYLLLLLLLLFLEEPKGHTHLTDIDLFRLLLLLLLVQA